ncbi:ParA family protein [Anabaena cylindrica UHCC 0172]|uniref:ParA family protein n=1 Tax=Anabaena cylindrica TaxID=1165 RepID=UPI002B214A31|nr:ParA family protein [Anabaena cylindrica]MEA5554041.1 ParA family protein [Anabaena cylindrica UHCC 0172]
MRNTPTVVTLGLAGGQGKSTVALMLGRYLGKLGIPVLFVDADPQSSLTSFLGVKVDPNTPTLLEVLTQPEEKTQIIDAIAPVPDGQIGERTISNANLFLIPSDDGLESANYKLASSGLSLFILRNRLQPIINNFGVAIVDPPPERSHLAQTSLGAGDKWVIPAESNVKGVQSLLRTLELIKEFKPALPYGELLGVVPFRARWTGLHPTKATQSSIDTMRQLVKDELMLPHILESDVYKNAINYRVSPSDLGQASLEYAIQILAQRLKPALLEKYAKLIPTEIA